MGAVERLLFEHDIIAYCVQPHKHTFKYWFPKTELTAGLSALKKTTLKIQCCAWKSYPFCKWQINTPITIHIQFGALISSTNPFLCSLSSFLLCSLFSQTMRKRKEKNTRKKVNKSIQEIFRIFRTYYVKDLFQFCFCVNNENWEEKSRKKCGKMCVHDLLVVWYCYIDCYCAMSIHVNMNRYKYSFLSLLLSLLFLLLLFFMRLAISFLWCENEVERNDVFSRQTWSKIRTKLVYYFLHMCVQQRLK